MPGRTIHHMMKRWRPALRWLAVGLGLAIVVLALRGRLPSPTAVGASLHLADTGWLLVAAAAEFVSMGMFARQQRRLLTAFGVTMPRHRALALAYSRSAITISVPAGSAVSAAYAFRQFRTGGASRSAATTVMVLSGLLSMVGLVLLYASGVLAAGALRLAALWHRNPGLVEGAIELIVGGAVLIVLLTRRNPDRTVEGTNPRAPRIARLDRIAARAPRLAALVRPVADAVRGSRSVAGRHWALALASATANWLTDLLCLVAAARAFHLPLSLASIGAIYLTVQLVRQIPLTPGGIGVIEMSLLAGLISAGAAEAPAAAAVLVYRLFSAWLILPVGLLGWLVLRRPYRGAVRSGMSNPAAPTRSRRETPIWTRPGWPARRPAATDGSAAAESLRTAWPADRPRYRTCADRAADRRSVSRMPRTAERPLPTPDRPARRSIRCHRYKPSSARRP
jgi:uncharacterized membrane protein YbhN (UPF0104 family)